MQHRYVGDVGDFGKYGLLRRLAQGNTLSLAVLWYLFPDETHNADGRHVGYLSQPGFRALDTELHSILDDVVRRGLRRLEEVESRSILPTNTVFFSEPLPFVAGSRSKSIEEKEAWLERALLQTASADLVFFDPDNGLQIKSVLEGSKKAGKYVFWNDLERFWERGQSLVVYHHTNRTAAVSDQTEALREKFGRAFPDAAMICPLLFRRGSCRHFWIVSQPDHEARLLFQIEALLSSGWDAHFEWL